MARKRDTDAIRPSETALVLSAAPGLHGLPAQTTMPRAEITGNASLSETGRGTEMERSLFTYTLTEQNIQCPV